ncbi:MAG: hypothetical protein JJU28_15910 [Cyclobacteriaceae bacterium]|nr:hypothetical protein [Cyclobacteriaceae bacterium]
MVKTILRLTFLLLTSTALLFFFGSCEMEEDVFSDSTLLIGKWKSGTLYYKYQNNGHGATWDTSDDVTEKEAQDFTWTLQKSVLTHIHVLEMGGTVPKVYKVTQLTHSNLRYEDDFGKKFSFTKVD